MSIKYIKAVFSCDECDVDIEGRLDPADNGNIMELAEKSIEENIYQQEKKHLCCRCINKVDDE